MLKQKFMMSLAPGVLKTLEPIARKDGVSVQELLRARIVPEWFKGPYTVGKQAYARGYKAGKKNGNTRKVSGNGQMSSTTR